MISLKRRTKKSREKAAAGTQAQEAGGASIPEGTAGVASAQTAAPAPAEEGAASAANKEELGELLQEPAAAQSNFFVRSPDRCHLINRIPCYDQNGQVRCYYLKFISSHLSSTGDLCERHIMHVLTGFFMRREVSSFIGQSCSAMLALPLCQELVTYRNSIPGGRIIIYLKGEHLASSLYEKYSLLVALKRTNLRFSCDLELLADLSMQEMYDVLSCIDFAMIYYDEHLQSNLKLLDVLHQRNPKLKSVLCHLPADGLTAIPDGVDYVMNTFFHPHQYYSDRQVLLRNADLFALIKEIQQEHPNFTVINRVVSRHPYMQKDVLGFLKRRHPDFNGLRWLGERLRREFGIDELRPLLALTALHGLIFISAQSSGDNDMSMVFEPARIALTRAAFVRELTQHFEWQENDQALAFVSALFSVDRMWAQRYNPSMSYKLLSLAFAPEIVQHTDNYLYCLSGLEDNDLPRFFASCRKLNCNPAAVLHLYEHALLWATEIAAEMSATNYRDMSVTLSGAL